MRIKKDPETRNEYLFAGGLWIRNFTKKGVKFINSNDKLYKSDYDLLLKNEFENQTYNIANIAAEERLSFTKVVIVSDGHAFKYRHKQLLSLGSDVCVIAVNQALRNWDLFDQEHRPINLYVVNNPYRECGQYFPRENNYFPTCIASSRTLPQFINYYVGNTFFYDPTPEKSFGVDKNLGYYIDDYRNPVCAAIGLAYQFGVKKLMLMCCDESFADERPAAEKLKNGLWTYPQQVTCQQIVDANLYWLSHQPDKEVKVADYSDGLEYENAAYITSEEGMISFFNDAYPEG